MKESSRRDRFAPKERWMPEISRERNGKRILLVEGEPRTCDSLSLFLRVKGYEPHVAASASAANKPLKRTRGIPGGKATRGGGGMLVRKPGSA